MQGYNILNETQNNLYDKDSIYRSIYCCPVDTASLTFFLAKYLSLADSCASSLVLLAEATFLLSSLSTSFGTTTSFEGDLTLSTLDTLSVRVLSSPTIEVFSSSLLASFNGEASLLSLWEEILLSLLCLLPSLWDECLLPPLSNDRLLSSLCDEVFLSLCLSPSLLSLRLSSLSCASRLSESLLCLGVVLSGDFCGLDFCLSTPEGPEAILSNRCLWNRVMSFCLVTSLASAGEQKGF